MLYDRALNYKSFFNVYSSFNYKILVNLCIRSSACVGWATLASYFWKMLDVIIIYLSISDRATATFLEHQFVTSELLCNINISLFTRPTRETWTICATDHKPNEPNEKYILKTPEFRHKIRITSWSAKSKQYNFSIR